MYRQQSGQLCSETGHDDGYQMQDYRNGNRGYGNRFSLHEAGAGRKNLYRSGVGMSPFVLLSAHQDGDSGRSGNGINQEFMQNEIIKENKVEKKRKKEQYVAEEMIRLYCRKNHRKEKRRPGELCPDCQELLRYVRLRSQKCPFMEEKTFCANCRVHCYKPEAGKNPSGDAVFRSQDAFVSSGACNLASGLQYERKTEKTVK